MLVNVAEVTNVKCQTQDNLKIRQIIRIFEHILSIFVLICNKL